MPHRLQRYGRDGGVSGLPILHTVGHRRGQHIGDASVFRVEGALGTADRDTIANTEAGVARINGLHDPGGTVAERARQLETIAHLLQCRPPAKGAGRVENFADLVGAGASFLQQAHPCLLDFHLLGAHADDRVAEANENAAGWSGRERHVLQFQSAILILRDLLQSTSPAVWAAACAGVGRGGSSPSRR